MFLGGLISVGAAFAQPGGNSVNSDDPAFRETQRIFRSTAGVDPGATSEADRRELISRGAPVVPHLVKIFHEAETFSARESAIFTLFQIKGAEGSATELALTELAQDPSEWRGNGWIATALEQMYKIDPVAARQAARLALRSDDENLVLASAVSILDECGMVDDIPALEALIARRRTAPMAAGQKGWRSVVSAGKAIETIRGRASGKNEIAAQAPKATSGQAGSAAGASATQAASGPSDSGSPWLWVLGGLVAITAVAFALRRGTKV